MNSLNNFYTDITNVLAVDNNIIFKLSRIKSILQDALAMTNFKFDCIVMTLNTMEEAIACSRDWDAPHLYFNDIYKISARVIYWPVFYDNNPHQHKTWSVTGVLYNEININTYHMIDGLQRLKRDKFIRAQSGEVGYLTPGCIHNIRNSSHKPAATFHLFNNFDIDNPEDNAIWYPSPRKDNLSRGLLERALSIYLDMLDEMDDDQSFELIQRIYRLSPISLKLKALLFMYKYDQSNAKKLFDEVGQSFVNQKILASRYSS